MKIKLGWIGERSEVAKFHNSGTSRLPKREHLSKFIKENKDKVLKTTLTKNFKAFAENRDKFYQILGNAFIVSYKEFIFRNILSPLKMSTIDRKRKKGSSHPHIALIDTGLMLNSLVFQVSS